MKTESMMIGTLIAALAAASIYFKADLNAESLSLLFGSNAVAISSFFFLVPIFLLSFAWIPLQKAEQNFTPRVSELFKRDLKARFYTFWLFLFPLLSLGVSLDLLILHHFPLSSSLALWVFLFGFTLDIAYLFVRKVFSFLDPFNIVKKFIKEADHSIQNDKEFELCQWIDGLSEVSVKAIQRNSLSLAGESIDALRESSCNFLISTKGMGHATQDRESKALGIPDKISYSLFFILQRLEMINEKVSEKHLEPLESKLLTAFGKTAVASAKCDITLTTYPLHFLGRSTMVALNHNLSEAGPKAIITLVAVAKEILSEIDVTYLELQPPFITLIRQMQMISQEMFRKDKTINIKTLTEPFEKIKGFFEAEKLNAHPDKKPILLAIDDALAAFATLEAIMRTIPPIPVTELNS